MPPHCRVKLCEGTGRGTASHPVVSFVLNLHPTPERPDHTARRERPNVAHRVGAPASLHSLPNRFARHDVIADDLGWIFDNAGCAGVVVHLDRLSMVDLVLTAGR